MGLLRALRGTWTGTSAESLARKALRPARRPCPRAEWLESRVPVSNPVVFGPDAPLFDGPWQGVFAPEGDALAGGSTAANSADSGSNQEPVAADLPPDLR